MVDVDVLKSLAMAATPGPWQWWTSNSTLRLTGADRKDGGVLCGSVHRGYGDVCCSDANRAFIEAANPAAVLELIEENARLKAGRATPPSPSTAPTEQNQAKSLPARRFVSVTGFWDADYVEFAEGCAKGGGVLNGVHYPKHYTRRQAESYVSEGAWREVAVPLSVEQSVPAGAAREGGNTNSNSVEFGGIKQSGTAPTVEVDELPPIEYDKALDRTYIPLPGGWEIQTKGNGSTFRIAHIGSRTRWMVLDDNLHEPLEALARDMRNALASKPPAREAAGEGESDGR